MDLNQKNFELKTIYQEYRSFFSEIDLKLTTGLLSNLNDGILSNRTSHINLITGEQQRVKVTVDLKGWFVMGEDQSFETFETLMMHISPSFTHKFNTVIAEKLLAI